MGPTAVAVFGLAPRVISSSHQWDRFRRLLATQLAEWLDQIHAEGLRVLDLVEVGPGEGDRHDVWAELHQLNPAWIGQLELVLVEPILGWRAGSENGWRIGPGQVR